MTHNIGQAADRSGVPPKTIRYYEDIGLVTPARAENGYRSFSNADVERLTFLGRSRALGFGIEDCRALLALWSDPTRPSADVKQIAQTHLDEIDAKIRDLRAMRATLGDLVNACAGDHRPDCPILNTLAPGDA